ncbi:MAG: DUF386 domain-containing protein [bacterium]|nr:DUF386 domain-containing protein [bacterium]
MILDTFEHWADYDWRNERMEKAFAWLEAMDDDIADARYDIDGDNIYCMVQTYETRPLEGHKFEAHRQYTDIQYILKGEEKILWAPQPELTVTDPYEPDAELYALIPNATELVLKQGRFSVFYPRDAHAPSLTLKKKSTVRKAVVKIRV